MIKSEHLNVMYAKTKEIWEIVIPHFYGLEEIDFYKFDSDEFAGLPYGTKSFLNGKMLEVQFDYDCNVVGIGFNKV